MKRAGHRWLKWLHELRDAYQNLIRLGVSDRATVEAVILMHMQMIQCPLDKFDAIEGELVKLYGVPPVSQ